MDLPSEIDLVIVQRTSEIAKDFTVRRILPSSRRRMVGPFIFLDQMGPELIRAGHELAVAGHPHIGLATVTYLFDGEMMHRDSLGSEQLIRPNEVNWMTAGRGIAHSERSPKLPELGYGKVFGLQTWVALPMSHEEATPSFTHLESHELPVLEDSGTYVRLIVGNLFGERSPAPTFSDMFYADVRLLSGARIEVPIEHEERAVYILEGSIEVSSVRFEAGQLLVIKPREPVVLHAFEQPAHLMLLGGAAMDGPRHIWWNFVSSSRERIEQAKADWRDGLFATIPGESEYIPLPPDRPTVAKYP